MKSKSILLVEDEKAIQVLILYNLQKAGFNVQLKNTGEEALEYLNQAIELPDLIISDVLLPGMNGINFCREIKNSPRTMEIPLILLSSVDYDFYRNGAISAGANIFMTKPFRIKDFFKSIKDLSII